MALSHNPEIPVLQYISDNMHFSNHALLVLPNLCKCFIVWCNNLNTLICFPANTVADGPKFLLSDTLVCFWVLVGTIVLYKCPFFKKRKFWRPKITPRSPKRENILKYTSEWHEGFFQLQILCGGTDWKTKRWHWAPVGKIFTCLSSFRKYWRRPKNFFGVFMPSPSVYSKLHTLIHCIVTFHMVLIAVPLTYLLLYFFSSGNCGNCN